METPDRKTVAVIRKVYHLLLSEYGKQGWWPVTRKKGGEPEYLGGPRTRQERFEVAVGAVLTQNTSWKNAAKAVSALSEAGMIDPARLAAASHEEVGALVRSSGYYNQKARRLGILARYFLGLGEGQPERESLLALEGVGPETADSILLYAYSRTFFVVDAYTNRLFSRLGVIRGNESYDRIRGLFEGSLERSSKIYNEYHALVIIQCKRRCLRVPVCNECPISTLCASESLREEG
ncbi:MAG: endonuclease [Candidatus Krumholzibacteria bacterium]|nr:endonuclease [Candidatus Krumholzibacteria bacterium]